MMKTLKKWILGLLLVFIFVLTSQAQTLPASAWYSIVYQAETNTLHWVNVAGEQATLPRPMLPGESEFLEMRVSPDGRYGIIVSRLVNDHEAFGIYDFEQGSFIQIHEAQDGESIHPGGKNIFTANSQYFAIGFMAGDFASPEWRVILFESATGSSVVFIDHTFPDVATNGLVAPLVQYIDGGTVHFVFQPQAVGGWIQNYQAYAWQALGGDPAASPISGSPYNRPDVQVLPLTGEIATTYIDEAYPIAAQAGQTPNYNAIGRSSIGDPTMFSSVHTDGTRFLLKTAWAKGGDWILFYTQSAIPDDAYWGIILADGIPGNNSYMPLDPQYTDVFGTNDGYIVLNDEHSLSFTNGFLPNTALNIFNATPDARVVYVTPIGATFSLSELGGNNTIALPTPTNATVVLPTATQAVITCTPVQISRISVGIQARAMLTVGGLNVRQNPNDTILAILAGGTTFNIIDGPQCIDGLYWWQIQRPGLTGWVAEGINSGYLIEPYNGPASDGLVATDTPEAPIVQATATPLILILPEAGCEQAPQTRLSTGMFATASQELRPRQSPNGEVVARRFYQPGVQLWILGGPQCAGGQRWWRVSGSAKVGRVGNNFEGTDGWVSEGLNGSYFLNP